MRYFIAICLIVFSSTIKAQNITGTWEEHSETRFTSYTKLCIVNICGKYIGFTYDSDKDGGYCKTDFAGAYNKKKQQLRGEGVYFMEHTTGHYLVIYNLYYKAKYGQEYLEGLVYKKPDTTTEIFDPLLDSIDKDPDEPEFLQLVKTSNKIDSTAYMKLMAAKPCKPDTPIAVITPPVVTAQVAGEPLEEKIIKKPLADTPVTISSQDRLLQLKMNRINDTLSVIDITEKELLIRVMDNAITDGDTISILHNGILIAEKILVSGKPYPVKFSLSKEDPYHELTLIAHNLGSIPPNTALLLISSGGKEHKLYAFADLKKNAVIIFRYIGQ